MKRLFLGLLTVIVFAGIAAAVTFLLLTDPAPRVTGIAPPSPEDVASTRSVFHRLRSASVDKNAPNVELSQDEINSALRVATRLVPGMQAETTVENGVMRLRATVPAPYGPERFANLDVIVRNTSSGPEILSVRAGQRDVPPALAAQIAALALRIGLSGNTGDEIIETASRMRLGNGAVSFGMSLSQEGLYGTYFDTFSALRGNSMPTPDEIDSYYVRIREAMDAGKLPTSGSFLPYINEMLEIALEGSDAARLPNDYTAAVFALAKACGARDFTLVVGPLAGLNPWEFGEWDTNCDNVLLNGRIDIRRHFITAAALQSASNRGVSVSIGEFKELYDTISGAGGFDFTDIAANNSGIRMTDRFMLAPPAEWPELMALITSERDLIVAFDDIPELMPQSDFEARFGDIDSTEYKDMIAFIEAKIDLLTLHTGQ